MEDERSVKDILDELADDVEAVRCRFEFCQAATLWLRRMGQVLWVTGYISGPDRASGSSPFGFANDRAVGIATVTQIAGELSAGIIELLKVDNKYSGMALVRQLVEVEYLVHAFSGNSDTAEVWLRADRAERRSFWSPVKVRKRSDGVFLDADYWEHCERGGHPTTAGMDLLPKHRGPSAGYVWVDYAGHLASIWLGVKSLAEELLENQIPTHWKFPNVEAAQVRWLEADGLYAALTDLGQRLRESDRSQ